MWCPVSAQHLPYSVCTFPEYAATWVLDIKQEPYIANALSSCRKDLRSSLVWRFEPSNLEKMNTAFAIVVTAQLTGNIFGGIRVDVPD